MNTSFNVRLRTALVFALLFLTSVVFGGKKQKEKWVKVPVVVNVLKGQNYTKADIKKMLRKANRILKPAKIKLDFKDYELGVEIGNKDDDLDDDERKEARRKGAKELKKYDVIKKKKGRKIRKLKGMKIYIGDKVYLENPDYSGFTLHESRYVFVQGDPNDIARTAALTVHELTHAWTVTTHSGDPCDNMSGDIGEHGGTTLRPEDVNEIIPEAKRRGKTYKRKVASAVDKNVSHNDGVVKMVDASGGEMDDFYDVYVTAGDPCLFDPCNPEFFYADITEVSLYCDEPYNGANSVIDLRIIPEGTLPEVEAFESFFDVMFDVDPCSAGIERTVQMHIWRVAPAGPLEYNAEMLDVGGTSIGPIDMSVHYNESFEDFAPYNHTYGCNIPPDFFGPGSEPYGGDVNIVVASRVVFDERLVPGMALQDDCNAFYYDIDNPISGAQITVTPALDMEVTGAHLIYGSGFAPEDTVTIDIEPETEEDVNFADIEVIVTADQHGNFMARFEPIPPISGGLGEYSVYAVGDTIFNDQIHDAMGFFTDQPLEADLDYDTDVDFIDFAYFAELWLIGVN